MRGAVKPIAIIRWVLACAVALAAVGGCAQIAGVDPWERSDACGLPGADPKTCAPSPDCIKCLYATHDACEAARMDCLVDPASACSQIYTCAGPCEPRANPVSCIRTCCDEKAGNTQYGTYFTCMCNECDAVCGAETLECDTLCEP